MSGLDAVGRKFLPVLPEYLAALSQPTHTPGAGRLNVPT